MGGAVDASGTIVPGAGLVAIVALGTVVAGGATAEARGGAGVAVGPDASSVAVVGVDMPAGVGVDAGVDVCTAVSSGALGDVLGVPGALTGVSVPVAVDMLVAPATGVLVGGFVFVAVVGALLGLAVYVPSPPSVVGNGVVVRWNCRWGWVYSTASP